MHYTYQTMWKYRYEQDYEEKPYFCLVEFYDYDEFNYKKYPNGKPLAGQGLDRLTKAEAEKVAAERNARLAEID